MSSSSSITKSSPRRTHCKLGARRHWCRHRKYYICPALFPQPPNFPSKLGCHTLALQGMLRPHLRHEHASPLTRIKSRKEAGICNAGMIVRVQTVSAWYCHSFWPKTRLSIKVGRMEEDRDPRMISNITWHWPSSALVVQCLVHFVVNGRKEIAFRKKAWKYVKK